MNRIPPHFLTGYSWFVLPTRCNCAGTGDISMADFVFPFDKGKCPQDEGLEVLLLNLIFKGSQIRVLSSVVGLQLASLIFDSDGTGTGCLFSTLTSIVFYRFVIVSFFVGFTPL
jgi:hypothetical protein